MKTTVLKKEMFDAINIIEDTGFLKAINLLLHEKSKEYEYELSEIEKDELDNLRDQHKVGKSKSYSMADVRKMAKDELG
jgi:signal-transduction protein with cAMP-binding, CBS, and nucleotidyltransferase domain